MDTVHDLGGVQGFGPIERDRDEAGTFFHEPWQGRTWALCMLMMGRLSADRTNWTLDWHRHVLERIPPAQYLSMDYFEKWVLGMMAVSIDAGLAGRDEFLAGRSMRPLVMPEPDPPVAGAEPTGPGFAAGDAVRARASIAAMHTRLPGYVRGRKGVIERFLGLEPFADTSALGDIRKEAVYTVRFERAELWPEARGERGGVYLDLWESYLERG